MSAQTLSDSLAPTQMQMPLDESQQALVPAQMPSGDSLQAVVPPGKVQKDLETPPAAEPASRADHELRMVSEAAARDPNKTLCGRCLREVQIGEAVMKTKSRSPKYICKTCNKVGSTLSRRLHGWPLPCWNSLSSTEQSQFWRSVCEQHDSAHGTLQYEKIKGLLTDVFERKVRSVTSHACTGPFLPLSVWESRGYDLEPIRAKAESREDDLFGTVYRVATLETGVKHEEEDVRSIIQKAERHVRKRKAEQSAGQNGSWYGLGFCISFSSLSCSCLSCCCLIYHVELSTQKPCCVLACSPL